MDGELVALMMKKRRKMCTYHVAGCNAEYGAVDLEMLSSKEEMRVRRRNALRVVHGR